MCRFSQSKGFSEKIYYKSVIRKENIILFDTCSLHKRSLFGDERGAKATPLSHQQTGCRIFSRDNRAYRQEKCPSQDTPIHCTGREKPTPMQPVPPCDEFPEVTAFARGRSSDTPIVAAVSGISACPGIRAERRPTRVAEAARLTPSLLGRLHTRTAAAVAATACVRIRKRPLGRGDFSDGDSAKKNAGLRNESVVEAGRPLEQFQNEIAHITILPTGF